MRIQAQDISDRDRWEKKGYALPAFDREQMIARTKADPYWIHFGPGNIFRAFQARVVQELLDRGLVDRGLIVAEGYDYEIIEKMNRSCDDYHLVVTLRSDGNIEKTVVGSIAESLTLDRTSEADFSRLEEIFRKPSLQMVSFTITEKGYALKDAHGRYLPDVETDLKKGPKQAESYMGKVAALLYERYRSGRLPIAMVSMDNCSHNGDRLREAIETFAAGWAENCRAEEGFLTYVRDEEKVSFPWTMIDKITPRPDPQVEEILRQDGIEGVAPVVTTKNTYVAPFVNAEETEYLIIEDAFPNGRCEALKKGGIRFTKRETVDQVEKMKVCTCLNPLHTALAVFGCLLGYDKIADEMGDQQLKKMAERIGYDEGLPVVVDPEILDPKEFLDTVLQVRIPNPFMPDTPQRIATDTSQKLSVRYGETIKAYLRSEDLLVSDLSMIPLVFAGWLRYLMAVDDAGRAFSLSPDPLLPEVCPYVSGFSLTGEAQDLSGLQALLANANIWGVDLYEAGMAEKVMGYFQEMITGRGAVRATLKKYV